MAEPESNSSLSLSAQSHIAHCSALFPYDRFRDNKLILFRSQLKVKKNKQHDMTQPQGLKMTQVKQTTD